MRIRRRFLAPFLLPLLACEERPQNYSECILKRLPANAQHAAGAAIVEACETLFAVTARVNPGTASLSRNSSGAMTLALELHNPNANVDVNSVDLQLTFRRRADDPQVLGVGSFSAYYLLPAQQRLHQTLTVPDTVSSLLPRELATNGQWSWSFAVTAARGLRVR